MEQLLTYGLNGLEELVHVQSVKNGLECGCRCPGCRHPLVAKNNPNNKKTSHFAHSSGKECDGAVESALHLLAKEVLLRSKKIRLPAFYHDYNPNNSASFFKSSLLIELDTVVLEECCYLGNDCLIPDAIGIKNSQRLFIEFANSHFVDEIKRQKIKRSGIACIEINISNLPLSEEAILDVLNQESPLKYCIVNQKLEKEYNEIRIAKEKEKVEREKIRLADIEYNEKLNEEKIKKYPINAWLKPLRLLNDGKAQGCPLKILTLQNKLPERFHQIPEIKRILNGEHWNGKFYGHGAGGKYIYLGPRHSESQKVFIYPPDRLRDFNDEISKARYDYLYAALKSIESILSDEEFVTCRSCKHLVDKFYIAEKDYRVCGHKAV